MNRELYMVFIALCFSLLGGCVKDTSEKTGELLSLQINVDGVRDVETTTERRSATERESATQIVSGFASVEVNGEGGFTTSIATSLESMAADATPDATVGNLPEATGSFYTSPRAASGMRAGYTYRIILYRKTSGEFWKSIEAKAGTPAFLDAERGATYMWYAWSYNDMESIPEPSDLTNPAVQTSTEKTFMYASGEITIPLSGQVPNHILGILFQHKVAQVTVRVDGRSLGIYAQINRLHAAFDKNSYLKKGIFNIRRNEITHTEVVPTEVIFNGTSETNMWEKNFFTVDPQAMRSYQVIIHDLPVTFSGASAEMANRNLATYFGAANKPVFTLAFRTAAIGQRLIANLFLNYQPSPLQILHISNNASFGYALQRGPSWDFLNSKVNFGDLPESVVKVGSWSSNPGEGAWIGGTAASNSESNRMNYSNSAAFAQQVAERLAATNTTNRPDIVIIGYDVRNINPAFGQALNTYLNNKGVVLMMLQEATNAESMNFFNTLFGVNNIGNIPFGSGGTMFPIEGNDPTDVILNGPFGDVRTRHWGEDNGTTLGLTNVPASQVTVYSYGNAINRAPVAHRVTMFRHNTKSFFYVGDGGFVAYTPGTHTTICPFRYDPVTKRPLPKPYGDGYGSSPARNAYNSIMMANVMAWAVKKAELEGIRVWKYAGPPKP